MKLFSRNILWGKAGSKWHREMLRTRNCAMSSSSSQTAQIDSTMESFNQLSSSYSCICIGLSVGVWKQISVFVVLVIESSSLNIVYGLTVLDRFATILDRPLRFGNQITHADEACKRWFIFHCGHNYVACAHCFVSNGNSPLNSQLDK